MPDRVYSLPGVRIYEWAAEGPQPQTDRDVVELIGLAGRADAQLIVIPAERLGDSFFRLESRLAGEILQKFMNYRLRVAILGDISRHVAESSALRDFVYECNRGRHIWFFTDAEELESRLRLTAPPAPDA